MSYLYLLLALSFAVSALGWVYFIYFFSIGYGLSISALAVGTAAVFYDNLTLPTAILLGVLFVYGIRLATYLFMRERKSASYKKILYQPDIAQRKPVFVMLMIWISCALLYVGQISPATFYLANLADGVVVNEWWMWGGCGVVLLLLPLELLLRWLLMLRRVLLRSIMLTALLAMDCIASFVVQTILARF